MNHWHTYHHSLTLWNSFTELQDVLDGTQNYSSTSFKVFIKMPKKNYFSKNSTNLTKIISRRKPLKKISLNKSCNSPKEIFVLLTVIRYTYKCHTFCTEFVQCKWDWKYFRNCISSRRKFSHGDTRHQPCLWKIIL